MISDSLYISFYSYISKSPTILSPKTDSQWQSSKTVLFQWTYNGYDYQYQYNIQVFNIDISSDGVVPTSWSSDSSKTVIGNCIVDTTSISSDQFVSINLSSLLSSDGIYLWRIRTKGTIAGDWGPWANDGRIRFDSVSPIIKNISIESKSPSSKLASSISDFSSPYIFTNRIVSGVGTVKDRHIDRSGHRSLCVYYDYRDHSLVLRAQSGAYSSSNRYYGMISFHNDEETAKPSYNVSDVVKSTHSYKIEKAAESSFGPTELTTYDDQISSGKQFQSALGELVYQIGWYVDGDISSYRYIPAGFPAFWKTDIYSTSSEAIYHPVGMNQKSTYVSLFPFNTIYVSGSRQYTFPDSTTSTFNNFIEMRYPPPYEDVFIIFNREMNEIQCYGQYNSIDDVVSLSDDPTIAGPFVLNRGYDVESHRYDSPLQAPTGNELIFTATNTSIIGRCHLISDNDGASYHSMILKSDYLFFNLYADKDNDTVIKIYLNSKILETVENEYKFYDDNDGDYETSVNGFFVEVHMRPDSDCSFNNGIESVETSIVRDEISIGRAQISPRYLTMFNEEPSKKTFYKYIKYPAYFNGNNPELRVVAWGNLHTTFQRGRTSAYNGSFRFKIPDFKFLPYYSPGSVYLTNSYSSNYSPIPHILDADPNTNSTTSLIGWDHFEIEASNNNQTTDNNYMIKSDIIYKNDFIKIMGQSDSLGQINPYTYSLDDLSVSGVSRGTIPHLKHLGRSKTYFDYGRLAYTMLNDGWSSDTIHYNQIDNGIYGIVDVVSKDTNEYTLYLKNFSNYMLKRSVSVNIELDIDQSTDFVNSITPVRNIADYTFNKVLTTNINTISNPNGPSLIYYLDSSSTSSVFVRSIVGDDSSSQGYYGADGSPHQDWAKTIQNPFGGHYIIVDNTSSVPIRHIEQIQRMAAEIRNSKETDTYRSSLLGTSSTYGRTALPSTSSSAVSARISGDTFAMGNIFGYITPTEPYNYIVANDVEISFDSGIVAPYEYKYKFTISGTPSDFGLVSGTSQVVISGTTNHDGGPWTITDITGSQITYQDTTHGLKISSSEIGNATLISSGSYSGSNTVRIFFDAIEDMSGISGIKTLQVDLNTANASIVSPQYFGPDNSSGDSTGLSILMQKINNVTFSITDATSRNLALENISTSRSPLPLVEYYFDNNITAWNTINSQDILVYNNKYGVGRSKFYYDCDINGTGFKILFIKLKDKSGNESDILPAYIYIDSGSSISSSSVDSATALSDDGELFVETDKTVVINTGLATEKTFNFVRNLIPSDSSEARSIVVKNVLTDAGGNSYSDYSGVDDLLIGFSDNYGLSFNAFAPFSSITSWRFTRPIAIRIKSFIADSRGAEPDWYFDPNHIRHYRQDSDSDFSIGISDKNNEGSSHLSFHVPGNATLTNITLVGLIEETTSGANDTNSKNWGHSNPIANKMYEFREEFIGKKLILGSDLSQSFTILDIFKTSDLSSIKRWSSGSASPSITIDGDNSSKIWIVIDDPDAICALILSRKFAYISSTDDRYDEAKRNTGWRNSFADSFSSINYTSKFGYEQVYTTQDDIPDSINDIVNSALTMSDNSGLPTADDVGDYYFYISPSSVISDSSGISTNEGWITRIYHAYDAKSNATVGSSILDKLTNNQLLGINVYNKLVFGEDYNVNATILTTSHYDSSTNETRFIIDSGRFDQSFIGLEYSIINSSTGTAVSVDSYLGGLSPAESNVIDRVSFDGECVVVKGNVLSLMSLSTITYTLRVTLTGLESEDSATGVDYTRGWWPDIDGVMATPKGWKMGTVLSSDTSISLYVGFAAVSCGSFYIYEDGYYRFKLETDSTSYSDFTIDYMRASSNVTDVVGSYFGSSISYSDINCGGKLTNATTAASTFYLRKGWHTGRFRYVSNSYPSYARVLYSRPGWNSGSTYYYVPLIGSQDERITSMFRSYRTIHGRILDTNHDRYPVNEYNVDSGKSSQYFRSTIGFNEDVSDEIFNVYMNQSIKVRQQNSPNEDYGDPILSTPKSTKLVFGATVHEEAYGIYESNIIDGGSDFRFWKTISWTPTFQPAGTSVEFYIRTGSTEEELLSKKWNNTGTSTVENILPAFTTSGGDIIKFSQRNFSSSSTVIINKFLQFKMVLKSRTYGVTPQVNDVTIVYSKQNSVNFFTTTFDISSNMVRAILTYNGEEPIDSSGVALTDIQFGMYTEEDSNGEVGANFSDYTIIPTNEAFSLSSLGILQNDKFRIGIKFISSSNSVPTCDEFSLMWEVDGDNDRTKDL